MLRGLRVCREEMKEKRKKVNYGRGGWKRAGQREETAKSKAKRERVAMGQ